MNKAPRRRALVVLLAAVFTLIGCSDDLFTDVPPISEDDTISDSVAEWNRVFLDAARQAEANTAGVSRAGALLHVAQFDAVNGINAVMDAQQHYESYHVSNFDVPSSASREAAAIESAFVVLSELFPDQEFDGEREEAIDTLPGGANQTAVQQGLKWGAAVAREIIDRRASDGHDEELNYTPPCDENGERPPSCWTRDLQGRPWSSPQFASMTPWTMTGPDQFRAPGPPALDSQEYADAVKEVKELGAFVAEERRVEVDQKRHDTALFWQGGGGTSRPPGKWYLIAQTVTESLGTTLTEDTRLFALLSMALADATVACWDSKFAYGFWRPVNAIHYADGDGNDQTVADPDWQPRAEGGSPEYSSGLTTYAGAAETILVDFVGTDDFTFELTSDDTGETRRYHRFSEATEQNVLSRIYLGNHFRFSLEDGLGAGRALGQHITTTFLQPVD